MSKKKNEGRISLTPELDLNSTGKLKSDIITLSKDASLPALKLKLAIDHAGSIKNINIAINALANDSGLKKISIGAKLDPNSITQIQQNISTKGNVNIRANIVNTDKIIKNIDNVRKAIEEPPEFEKAFAGELIKFPAAEAAKAIYSTLKNGLVSAVDTIISVDGRMNELKRTLSDSTNTDAVLKNSISLAKELGMSIESVLETTTVFARQGFNSVDATALAQVSSTMQNISGMNADESMKTLTSALQNFNIEARNSMQIADKITEVNNLAS
ncbi:phage tail tape measure protein [Paenibacillus sp. GCM10027626]|uniref:phage tail tape measure protein n=1 Tax=Paenibacillus sp. GCM10027626 TaxID=3273411 RepID=UPI0036396FF1